MPNVMPINDVVFRCERLRGAGRLEETETLCRRVLVQVAAHGGLLFQSAAAAFATVEPRVALDRFKRVRVIMPGASAVHYNIGVCERRIGRHDAASRHLRKAQFLEPGAAGALDSLAQSQIVLRNPEMAMILARRGVVLRPLSTQALSTFGFVAWKAERREVARRALRRALLVDPRLRDADINLANVLVRSGRHSEGIRRYRRLLRLVPEDSALLGNLGVALVGIGDWSGAAEAYARYARLIHGRPQNQATQDPFPELPAVPASPGSRTTAWHRLKFDSQQLRYLLDLRLLPAEFETALEAYKSIDKNLSDQRRKSVSFDLTEGEIAGISRYHDRLVHLASTNWKTTDLAQAASDRAALNQQVDWERAVASYSRSTPAVTVIDNFLDPMALSALRKFCLRSTVWFELKGAGYLGAYFREGFNDPLLLAIAEELSEKMPRIFAGHPLRMIWAYTYEQSMVGINPHADFARINVNFWITPDSANLDPRTGGLLIYRRPAPDTWGFDKYNAAPGREIMAFLGDDAADPIRVPHRQNRAVIFDSRLFHETDRLNFREGLENRRINITMLFGDQ
jgi:tetratricopeptide (TPR) repeat protein